MATGERHEIVGAARVGRTLAGEGVPEARHVVGSFAVGQLARHHRAVQAGHAEPLHLEVQAGDVAVAEERLGILPQQVAVEVRQELHGARPAPRASDRGHAGVGEELVQLPKAALDRARREALAFQDALRDPHGEAEPLQLQDAAAEPLLVHGSRGRGHAYEVPLPERPGLPRDGHALIPDRSAIASASARCSPRPAAWRASLGSGSR